METIFKLSFILRHIKDFTWSDALFLPENEVWCGITDGMVLEPDDVEEEEDEIPEIAKKGHLIFVLSIQTLQSIIENAYEQKNNCTEDELLRAFLYYYDNDAYINLE